MSVAAAAASLSLYAREYTTTAATTTASMADRIDGFFFVRFLCIFPPCAFGEELEAVARLFWSRERRKRTDREWRKIRQTVTGRVKKSETRHFSTLLWVIFFSIFFGKSLASRTFFSPSVPGFPPSFSPEGGKWSSCSFSSFLELDDKSGEEEEEKSLHRCPPTKRSVFFFSDDGDSRRSWITGRDRRRRRGKIPSTWPRLP